MVQQLLRGIDVDSPNTLPGKHCRIACSRTLSSHPATPPPKPPTSVALILSRPLAHASPAMIAAAAAIAALLACATAQPRGS
jgi:hypothetical protein